MSDVTYYVALPFSETEEGLAPGQAEECRTRVEAVSRAEALSRKEDVQVRSHSAAADAQLIRKFGNLPEDLSAL